jgi:hypothetical protein
VDRGIEEKKDMGVGRVIDGFRSSLVTYGSRQSFEKADLDNCIGEFCSRMLGCEKDVDRMLKEGGFGKLVGAVMGLNRYVEGFVYNERASWSDVVLVYSVLSKVMERVVLFEEEKLRAGGVSNGYEASYAFWAAAFLGAFGVEGKKVARRFIVNNKNLLRDGLISGGRESDVRDRNDRSGLWVDVLAGIEGFVELEEIKDVFDGFVEQSITGNEIYLAEVIGGLYKTRGEKYGEYLVGRVLELLGVDFVDEKELLAVWQKTAKKYYKGMEHSPEEFSLNEAVRVNIETMLAVEKRDEGAINRLGQEYGIRCFGRYPVNMLVKQDVTRGFMGDYGVLYESYDDHNGAGYAHRGVYDDLDNSLGDGYVTLVVEGGGKVDFVGIRRRLEKHDGKVEFVIVESHGEDNAIHIGRNSKLSSDDIEDGRVERYFRNMKSWASIVLVSCSTGNGFARVLSRVSGKLVIAPTEDTAVNRIVAERRGEELRLYVQYEKSPAVFFRNGVKLSGY